ncbi:hypothetical protein SO802_011197 [Lithocarpus litseifolius]|uniref:Uncharacterized protein n=1 Tax=Lithocarpus litseifolius TaxID=425828 RepID=A0AAW2D4M5_9ROSI
MDIKFKLNEKTKVSVHCKYECGWRVYASQILGELTFQIKTMVPTCTCGRTFKHSQDVFANLSINQVYKTKRKAKEFILGDERLQYGKLRDYAEMIRVTDVGSKVILQTEITKPNIQPMFKRIYVRNNSQKVEFMGVGRDGLRVETSDAMFSTEDSMQSKDKDKDKDKGNGNGRGKGKGKVFGK